MKITVDRLLETVMALICDKISNPFIKAKCGILGHGQSAQINDDPSEQYALITLGHDVLEFDRKEATALCIGINKRFHHNYASSNNESFEKTIARDAIAIGEAFVTNLGLYRDHVKVGISSTERSDCTKKGVGALFVQSAKMAGDGGIFIFYFAGHGVLLNNKCILAPADFAGREDLNSGISGDDLVDWLHKAECKASHVLVILDCCFAGDLGTALTSPDKILKIKPGLFVMCGCAARERCMSVDALGHTIFTYFFLHYLEGHQSTGKFAVKQAMEKITELCFSFSSLLVSYDHEKGELQARQMNPTLGTLDYHETEVKIDEPDSCRFELVIKLFERGHPKPAPHAEVTKWLRSPTTQNALFTLHSNVKFSETLQKGILSAMLYSAASIHYSHDKTHLEERNLFLMTVIDVLSAIGFVCPEVKATTSHLISGLKHYIQPALVGGINIAFFYSLLSELRLAEVNTKADNISNVTAISYDIEDSGDQVDCATAQPNMLNKVILLIY